MLLAAALLLAGFALCFWLTDRFNPALVTLGPLGPLWLGLFILLIAVLAWMPPTAAFLDRCFRWLASASPKTRLINAFAVAVASPAYLYITARLTHRQLFPYIHDEFSYLIQARQFAALRLWMPGHPLGMFLDSFQIFTQPVYASAYFPGTALAYVPGVLLHLQPFVTALVITGIVMGLVCWVVSELIDGAAGWLAALLLMSDLVYRKEATLVLAHMPVLMYSLAAFACWLTWRKNHRSDWAIGIGFFLGLAAVTRPVDALCFAIPMGAAIVLRCIKQRLIPTIPAIIGGALPLLILQLLLNHGITGKWTQTPFQLYADREYPGSNYGFETYRPEWHSESTLPQMTAMYDFYRPLLAAHRWANAGSEIESRARYVLSQISPTPFPLLVILLPMALLGVMRLRADQRAPALVLLAFLPLVVLLYLPYFLYLPTYTLAGAPAVILGILLGWRGTIELSKEWARFARVGIALLIAGLSLAALPNWWNQAAEDVYDAHLLADVAQKLAALPHQRAVVFFKYDPRRNMNEEPVYNADAAWPDDAPVIRLHDLGAMDSQAIQYYAQRQPDRVFYWYDEATGRLTATPR
jgi:uncharacterized membrane protein YhaH (DUF805 family)